jgi:hypothetical protein
MPARDSDHKHLDLGNPLVLTVITADILKKIHELREGRISFLLLLV